MTEERVVMDSEWTDKRMDDFVGRVGRFEGDVKRRFDKVDARFDKVDDRFDRVERRLDAMTWAIFGSTASIVAVLVAQILFG
jgi:hypothetical protein